VETNLKNQLTKYSLFMLKKRSTHKAKTAGELHRFCARYRVAKSFRALELEGYTKRTIKTYSAITDLFFAYTAYELLVKTASGPSLRVPNVEPIDSNVIFDGKIAAKLRNNLVLKDILLEHTKDANLRNKLKSFYARSFDDIVCVAYAIRNLFAHGNLTTTDIGIGRASDRRLLDDISERMLAYCDEIFTKCVARL
jgi:hypothetical protein